MYAAAVLIERDASSDPALDRSVGRLLQQAADAGNPEAHIQRVLRLPDEQRTADNPFVIRSLRAAEGQARAHMMLAVLLGLDSPEAVEHLIKAFDGGLPEAQLLLALSTERAPQRDALFIRAAFGGNGAANLILTQQALMRNPDAPDREAALQWLASGAVFGHTESAARLAALLWLHPELDPDSTDSGLDAVRQLDAEAGREIAMRVPEVLLDVAPYNSDPSEGVRLLQILSAEGIGEATLMLADLYRFGEAVERDLQAAAEAYRLAEQQGAAEATYEHAHMAAFDLDQPERALELAEVEALVARLDTPHPHYLSTLAACQAAFGDFAHARANHRVALEHTLKEMPDETDVHEEMRQRLALYEADRPYVWSP